MNALGNPMAENRGDAVVRKHFDSNTDLYVDKYDEPYKAICRERIRLLEQFLSDRWTPCSILDVGCGAGVFVDMLLETYPQARAIGVDSSAGMLGRNIIRPRKALLLGDARDLPFHGATFDLINVDTVMHHLVDFRGYRNTIENIESFLLSLHGFLKPGGLLIVHEIYHESHLREYLGCRLVYELSTLRLPTVVANVLKRLGLNTVNAGVCFLTRRQWSEVFERTGFDSRSVTDSPWIKHRLEKMGFRYNGDLYYTLLARELRDGDPAVVRNHLAKD